MRAFPERLGVGKKGGLSFAYFGVGRVEDAWMGLSCALDPFVLLCGFVSPKSLGLYICDSKLHFEIEQVQKTGLWRKVVEEALCQATTLTRMLSRTQTLKAGVFFLCTLNSATVASKTVTSYPSL